MKLILFGAPGSGKGTQSDVLAQDLNLSKISLGDILRQEVKKGSVLGLKVKGFMDQGDLVPDGIVEEVIEANLNQEDFILDGYPRNRNQAQTLETILGKKNTQIDVFIYLDVSQEIIIQRLSQRRVCRDCNANYHLIFSPSKKSSVCDDCGSDLIQRGDDHQDVIKKRWQVFMDKSQAVLDFYRDKGIFLSVDGNKSRENVLRQIKEELQKRKLLKVSRES